MIRTVLHCAFREVLLLDADNVPVRNPEFLFDRAEYKRTGAVFWPDFDREEPPPNVWAFCGIPFRKEPPFESGQNLVDKSVCWKALNLAMWFNENSDFFYKYLLSIMSWNWPMTSKPARRSSRRSTRPRPWAAS